MAQHTQNKRIIELGVAQVNINSIDLGLAMAALAQENARARVAASAPTALTDSSGGTAATDNALIPVATPTIAAVDGVVGMAPKAAFDTLIGVIEDGHQELIEKTNELIVLIAGSTAATLGATDGAAGDNTIAAIAASLTATVADDEGVDAATGNTQIVTARNNQAAIAGAVNWCRVAMGLDVITDNSGGVFERTATEYSIVDAAATGTAAANAANSLTDTSVDAALLALQTNVASLAAAINEMRGTVAIGPFVVATHNPRTRFAGADVTV